MNVTEIERYLGKVYAYAVKRTILMESKFPEELAKLSGVPAYYVEDLLEN